MRSASASLTLRRLQAGDLPVALRLTQSQQWTHRLDDEVVARRLGKSRSAVRSKRNRMSVPMYRYRKGPRVG